jgi:branched-chain amino acid transport system substrate-binding protein
MVLSEILCYEFVNSNNSFVGGVSIHEVITRGGMTMGNALFAVSSGSPGKRRLHRVSVVTRFSAALAFLSLGVVSVATASGAKTITGLPKGTPITVGASLSLTGDYSSDGLATEQGYETWAAFENAHGGILGHKIKLVIVNDNSDPVQAANNYEDLITVKHVNFTVGGYSTHLTLPSAQIASRFGYALTFGIAEAPKMFAAGLKNIFCVSPSGKIQLLPLTNWLAKHVTPQPVAYASIDDPFTQSLVSGAESALTSGGFNTAYATTYPLETTDFAPIGSSLIASGAKIMILGTQPPDGEAFIQEMIQANYNPKILLEVTGPDQGASFVQAVGAKNTEGVMVPNSWYPGATGYQSAAMLKLYMKMFGKTVGNSIQNVSADVAEVFATGQVLTQALTHTNSLSNAVLMNYYHTGALFKSVQGNVRFEKDGENLAGTSYIFQWQGGKLVPVLPLGSPGAKKIEIVKPHWGSAVPTTTTTLAG